MYTAYIIATYAEGKIKTKYVCRGDISPTVLYSIVEPMIIPHKDGYHVICRLGNVNLTCKDNAIVGYRALSAAETRQVKSEQPKRRKTYCIPPSKRRL
jgi:hypothetical protein